MRFCTVSLALALRLLFYALTVVPLVEVAKTEWTVVFSMSLQGEKPAALVLCLRRFLGAMIIMRPGVFDVSADTLVVLLSAALTAAVFIVVKELSHTESSLAISAWMCVFVGAMSLPFAVNFWIWPTPTELLLLAAIGALATSAQYAAAEALRHSETNAMVSAEFLKLIWATVIGYFIFNEISNLWVHFGALAITWSNIVSTLENRRLPRRFRLRNRAVHSRRKPD